MREDQQTSWPPPAGPYLRPSHPVHPWVSGLFWSRHPKAAAGGAGAVVDGADDGADAAAAAAAAADGAGADGVGVGAGSDISPDGGLPPAS